MWPVHSHTDRLGACKGKRSWHERVHQQHAQLLAAAPWSFLRLRVEVRYKQQGRLLEGNSGAVGIGGMATAGAGAVGQQSIRGIKREGRGSNREGNTKGKRDSG